jgi:AcrR family transcriptional regulator
MPSDGLRERKKARTRQLIAETAARLFAERGYEQVAVSDVARAAEVAEQTVYNYFPTKEQLVTDREQQIQDRLVELIRSRPRAMTPAGAIREFVLEVVAGIRKIPAASWRGEIGYLAVLSPTVHRVVLEVIDRQAAALASVISETSAVSPEVAKLQGIALSPAGASAVEQSTTAGSVTPLTRQSSSRATRLAHERCARNVESLDDSAVRHPVDDHTGSLTGDVVLGHRDLDMRDDEVVTQGPDRGGSLTEGVSGGGAAPVNPAGRVLVLPFEVQDQFGIRRLEMPHHVLVEDVRVALECPSNELDIRSLSGRVHRRVTSAMHTPSGRKHCEADDRDRTREDAGAEAGGARVPASFRKPAGTKGQPDPEADDRRARRGDQNAEPET